MPYLQPAQTWNVIQKYDFRIKESSATAVDCDTENWEIVSSAVSREHLRPGEQ